MDRAELELSALAVALESHFLLAPRVRSFNFRQMKPYFLFSVAAFALTALAAPISAAEVESGFTLLCDGTTFDGWKASIDNTNTWKIEDGAFVTRGPTA